MRLVFYIVFLLFPFLLSAQLPDIQEVFKNKKDGYGVFRIPTIIKTENGKILAFCEGRKSLFDDGNIDLVMKTSTDNGMTWSSLKVIWEDGQNTCGNPSPVFDKLTGDIIIVGTLNNDRVFVLRSKDEGNTWEKPVEITSSVKLSNWKWYASGPVHAIQLENNKFKNRILVPCNHTVIGDDKHISHVIYSDDHGETWQLGGSVLSEKTDECTVAELTNGDLLLNMRNEDRVLPHRKISISHDGGMAWTVPLFDSLLVEPICQGALLRYSFEPDILLFSNPKHAQKRKNLTISISNNNGKTWAKTVTVYTQQSAYSDMAVLENGDILCLFETGKILPYGGIFLQIIKKQEIIK